MLLCSKELTSSSKAEVALHWIDSRHRKTHLLLGRRAGKLGSLTGGSAGVTERIGRKCRMEWCVGAAGSMGVTEWIGWKGRSWSSEGLVGKRWSGGRCTEKREFQTEVGPYILKKNAD